MHLLTLEDQFAVALLRNIEQFEPDVGTVAYLEMNHHLWPFYLHPGKGQDFVRPFGRCDDDAAIFVRVYRGRWLTDCPWCSSAQDASALDRWFFCANCKNGTCGYRSVPVIWPSDADEIEEVLLRRPFLEARNWFPGESVELLVEENDAFMEKSF